MASRPRAGRGTAGRDSSKDVDVTADVVARLLEGLRKAEEHHQTSQRLGRDIMALEEEIKTANGTHTIEQHNRLDDLYRQLNKAAEDEKDAHETHDLANNLAILQSLTTPDEPAPSRNGATSKTGSRGKPGPRATGNETAAPETVVVDSPGPSPVELKRVKGIGTQRSSSVASAARSAIGTKVEVELPETNRGVLAERAGKLQIGTEVFLRQPNASEGIGIQCIIKKIWHEKKPISYDVHDPEPDSNGKVNNHKCTASELIPIPALGTPLATISTGSQVFARYPETDTFYKATVKGFHRGLYTLKFYGEEDDKEMDVDKRFVLDSNKIRS